MTASSNSDLKCQRRSPRIDAIVDWFIPPALAADRDRRQQARMFLISHIFGPFIGNVVPLAIYSIEQTAQMQTLVLAASICGFWAFPFLLRAGVSYNALALASIQNLIFCISWSVYFYGGSTSPTLPWVLTIPLLSFLYLNASPKLWGYALALFAVNCAVFWWAYTTRPLQPSSDLLFEKLQMFGMISTVATAGYMAMMSTYYGRALASQKEIETEMRQHLATASELRRATEEAERASAAKSAFVARMSHELRTPLNAVIGYSQILLEDADEAGDEDMTEDLARIQAAGQDLLKLVNGVLDLSKIEAGRMELSPANVEASRMIERVAETMRARAEAAGLRYIVEAGDVGPAWWDEAKVRQALVLIIDNAIKFTREGQVRIAVRAVEQGGAPVVRISVEDTGVGIAAKALSSVFEQFSSEDDATCSKYGGRGLGLALARKLCLLMGGDIRVRSQLGAGSVFTLSLPRGEARTAERTDADMLADAQIARLRRLIAETPAAPAAELSA